MSEKNVYNKETELMDKIDRSTVHNIFLNQKMIKIAIKFEENIMVKSVFSIENV